MFKISKIIHMKFIIRRSTKYKKCSKNTIDRKKYEIIQTIIPKKFIDNLFYFTNVEPNHHAKSNKILNLASWM